MRNLLIFAILLLFVACNTNPTDLSGIPCNVPCTDPYLSIRIPGHDTSGITTRVYEAGSSFSVLIEERTGYAFIESGEDYELYLPAENGTYRISGMEFSKDSFATSTNHLGYCMYDCGNRLINAIVTFDGAPHEYEQTQIQRNAYALYLY